METVGGGAGGSARFGAFLRSRRERLGLSQEDVAIAVGDRGGSLSRSTLSRIENGKSLPEFRDAVILCDVLGVRLARLAELAIAGEPAGSGNAADAPALVREGEALAASSAHRAARVRFERALLALEGESSKSSASLRRRAQLAACWCLVQERAYERAFEMASRVVNDDGAKAGERLRGMAFEVLCLTELDSREEAATLADRTRREIEGPAAESPAVVGFVRGMLGEHEKQLGRFEKAAEEFRAAGDAWTRAAIPLELARARCLEAWCALRSGEAGRAAEVIAEAAAVAREHAPALLPEVEFVTAAIEAAEGNREGAVRRARSAAAVARETGNERAEFLCLHLAWSVLLEEDRFREARELRGRLDHLARSLAAVLEEARDYLARRAGAADGNGKKEDGR